MKYQNLTGHDIELPVRQSPSPSGVRRPINHIVVKDGTSVEVSEENEQFAIGMGLTMSSKAVKGAIAKTEVETKVLDEAPEEEEKSEPESKPTEEELFALNKKEQVKILKDLGEKMGYELKIPKYEKKRVAKILELQ